MDMILIFFESENQREALDRQLIKTVLMIPLVTMIITDQFSGTEIKIRLIMKMRMELHIVNVIQNMA